MHKYLLITLLLCSGCALQGCVPLLVGTAVYGVQKGKANRTERMKVYDEYRISMEELNMDRETRGLEPIEIEPYEQWERKAYSEPIL